MGKKTDCGMRKMCTLCFGSPRRAAVLTLTPSSACSVPVCTLVVVTPASTCPSRCQEEHRNIQFSASGSLRDHIRQNFREIQYNSNCLLNVDK